MKSTIQQAISALSDLLGERLSTGESIRELHSHDEAYSTPALPDAVAFPESTEEVSALMKICHQYGCPVVPYGVGTSLEGHVIPTHGGITVDTSRMNAVLAVNESDLDAVVQPGVTRKQLNTELRATGLMFTVDPGADATMGGMAATRASGTNTVRYGTMRENVLALEVVLANGEIIRTGTRAKKSASGYDLTHLLIGSEGTLGIITELTVKLHGMPDTISSATCYFETIDDTVQTVIQAIQVGIPIARVEFLDEVQMQGMNKFNTDLQFDEKPHLFLEFHGSEASVAEQVDMFKQVGEDLGMSRFQWATKTEDRNRLWHARHNAYYAGKALRPGAASLVTDCCVPISALADCIAQTKQLIEKSGLIAPIVGHVGDGNFHLLILFDENNNNEVKAAKQLAMSINEIALAFGGSITGEHGIGTGKKRYMEAEHGAAYDVMKTLKASLDPKNILNPGKILDVVQ